jgi:hypothetical protein
VTIATMPIYSKDIFTREMQEKTKLEDELLMQCLFIDMKHSFGIKIIVASTHKIATLDVLELNSISSGESRSS